MDILILDADFASRTGSAELLSKLGHRIQQFSDGQEALNAILETDFQMVLAQTESPVVSGLELLRAISALPSGGNSDVVLIGEPGKPELIIAAFKAGAYDYLLKPVNYAKMVEIAQSIALRRSRVMKGLVSIVIFDQIPLFRTGFVGLLSAELDYNLVGETASAEEFLVITGVVKPDIAVVDVDSGLDIVKTLKKSFPAVKVVLFSSQVDSELAINGLAEGGSAFLLKDADREDILFVLKKVARGGHFIDTRITRLITQQTQEERVLVQLLTDQENRVLSGLARGLTNKEIANELFLSTATVRNYISNILRKLELPNRAAATAYGIKCFKVGESQEGYAVRND